METINTGYEKEMDISIFEPYQIDCGKCCGLCCVALYFTKSDGFPKDKKAGVACENLQSDYRCKVHSNLSKQGLKGCMAYDCFGAGQFVTRHLKTEPNWLTISSQEADEIINFYLAVMRVHQTLWYLSQCIILQLPQSEKQQAKSLINEGRAFLEKPCITLADLNTQLFCEQANQYLKHICALYQKNSSKTSDKQTQNYMGKNMKRKNLEGKDLSMTLLIAANFEQANLSGANFLGADMRDTNLCNTDVSQSLFLTQIQINAAKGNKNTILPPYLHKPEAWNCT